ncbi:isopentenyl phosphate kinase family protein [Candidatus Micrarchaeota archaeon]|nr:isopentenyl phosphate kinase family protein [Candidatus Micrarchaeota archaeon]
MSDLVFVKLGGSLITDKSKPYTARLKTIARIANELQEASWEGARLLVGHGGGSFPHTSAAKYRTSDGMINGESVRGIAVVQGDASKLNRIVVETFLQEGLNAVSVQPSANAVAKNRKIVSWDVSAIEQALKHEVVPVVYGDVLFDLGQGCCIASTEELFSFLAPKLKPKRIVLAARVNGVLDGEGQTIPKITSENYGEVKKHLKGSDATDVTGGMRQKVEFMLELAKKTKAKIIIVNGDVPDNVENAVKGLEAIGTIIE